MVLILVVMEEGLVPMILRYQPQSSQCRLNPCCNGRGSRTSLTLMLTETLSRVLILVVMEEGLVLQWDLLVEDIATVVLILVVMEEGLVHGFIVSVPGFVR